MRKLLLLALLCAASCRTAELPTAPHTEQPGKLLHQEPYMGKLDSVTVTTPKTLAQKAGAILGIKPRPSTSIGKKSTVSYYYGPATISTVGKKATAAIGDNATATTIEKPKAPVAVGDSATAQDFTKQGQRGGAAASGAGATATATTKKGLSYWLLLIPAAGLGLYVFRKSIPFLG